MVKMCVSDDHRVELRRHNGTEAAIAFLSRAVTLEHAAIDDQRRPIGLHQIARTCDFAGGTAESNLHRDFSKWNQSLAATRSGAFRCRVARLNIMPSARRHG